MKIGDEILLRAKIVDFDSNPHGAAIRVEIAVHEGTMDTPCLRFWIHRLEQPDVLASEAA